MKHGMLAPLPTKAKHTALYITLSTAKVSLCNFHVTSSTASSQQKQLVPSVLAHGHETDQKVKSNRAEGSLVFALEMPVV